ncbi:MAG TPA: protein phosphatase, partial [Chloroflexia bacterium]|nr:protein phosphatase [Chloroflexia bacterium]
QISPEELYTHPRRNEIYRALGDPRLSEPEVDVFTHRLQPGDALLVCSDGLWDFVRDATIAGTLQSSEQDEPFDVCQKLINLANDQGGEDNISAIFVRFVA